MRQKYPRTWHLPFSLGLSNDDKVISSLDILKSKEIVVTDKLDGENTTMYHDYIHARSLDSRNHPSRNWVKNLHGTIKGDIPENYRICGENLFAAHSIHYHSLKSYFYVFGIYEDEKCLSWDQTVEFSHLLGLETVPVLYRGPWDEEKIKACFSGKSFLGDEQEGYVVRITDAFSIEDHGLCVAKFVRRNHVQTDSHWASQEIIQNLLTEVNLESNLPD